MYETQSELVPAGAGPLFNILDIRMLQGNAGECASLHNFARPTRHDGESDWDL